LATGAAQVAGNVSAGAAQVAGNVSAGAAQVAGNVSAGAGSAKAVATVKAQQGMGRVQRLLMQKPAILLGGAFALGILIARLV